MKCLTVDSKYITNDNFSPRHYIQIKISNDIFSRVKFITLQEIGTMFGGSTPSIITSGDTPFIKNSNIKTNDIDDASIKNIKYFGKNKIIKNDVLIQCTGSIGKSTIYYNTRSSWINQNIVCLRINNKNYLPEYVAAFLNSTIMQNQINSKYTQTIQKFISLTALKKIKIPEMAMSKQLTIKKLFAEAIKYKKKALDSFKTATNQVDNILKFEYNKDNYFSLTRKQLDNRFFTPRYYKNFPVLEDFNKNIEYKKSLGEIVIFNFFKEPGSAFYRSILDEGRSIPFIRSSDIYNFSIDYYPQHRILRNSFANFKFDELENNNIFFTKDGKIGIVFMIRKDDEKCIFQSSIVQINSKYKDIPIEYIMAILNSDYGKKCFLSQTVISSTLPHLQDYKNIIIPIMTKDIMKKIKELVNSSSKFNFLYREKRKEIWLYTNQLEKHLLDFV